MRPKANVGFLFLCSVAKFVSCLPEKATLAVGSTSISTHAFVIWNLAEKGFIGLFSMLPPVKKKVDDDYDKIKTFRVHCNDTCVNGENASPIHAGASTRLHVALCGTCRTEYRPRMGTSADIAPALVLKRTKINQKHV